MQPLLAVSKAALLCSVLLTACFAFTTSLYAQTPRILVFSKTEGFRHASIDAGKKVLAQMATDKGFAADFTEDANQFITPNLKKYNAVVFF